MRAIHQLVAGFIYGDAISNEALVLQALFRSWGYDSQIFSEAGRIHPALRHEARLISELPDLMKTDDIALLHLSIGSVVNDRLTELPGRKALLYHNMTPAEYFRGIQEPIARDLAWGRKQLQALAGAAEVVMADSRFNASELQALGYRDVRVLPIILDYQRLQARPAPLARRAGRDGRCNILFVGRGVPNKRIEDALRAFYYFQQYVEPRSRFIHVGSYTGLERYRVLAQALARELDLRDVQLTGAVSQAELNAYYAGADLFLCLSEHEGFCIPLLESMAHDVPVLAYAAAAVPETLDGAGVLVHEKRWDWMAELMGGLRRGSAWRDAVIRKQRERLARFKQRDLAGELQQHLAPILG